MVINKRQTIPKEMVDHCILCKDSNFSIVHQKDQWLYLRCLNCGLVSLYPKPTIKKLMENYEHYLPAKPERIRQWAAMMKPVIDKSADLIESRTENRKGKLLDIGCGYGFFLKEMKSRGWKTEGIEISEIGKKYAQNKWDIRVYSRPLEDLNLPDSFYDVITLFYVIEHVYDPLSIIKEASRILKPGGLILLRWPHSTPIIQMLGPISKKLNLYHTPYHLYDFSPMTMKKMLNYCGFREIETTIAGNSRPPEKFCKLASIIFGEIGETLWNLSGGHFLLPGISKTTMALK